MKIRNPLTFIFVVIFAVFTSVIILKATDALDVIRELSLSIIILSSCMTLLVGSYLIWRIREEKFDLFESINFFLFTMVIGFVYRPLYVQMNENGLFFFRDLWMMSVSTSYKYATLALLYAMVGTVIFLVSYVSRFPGRIAVRLPLPSRNDWSDLGVVFVIISYSVLGLAGFIGYIVIQGGMIGSYQEMLGSVLLAKRDGTYFFQRLAEFIMWANLIWFAKTRKLTPSFLLHSLMVILIMLTFYVRQFVVAYILMLMILRHYLVKRTRWHEVLGAFSAVILFMIIWVPMRYYIGNDVGLREAWQYTVEYESLGQRLIGGVDFSFFDFFALVLYLVPHQWPYQVGYSLKVLMSSSIPRVFWADKPIVLHREFANYFPFVGSQAPGISYFGEFYINGGPIGIVIGMIVVGCVFGVAYNYLKRDSDNPSVVLIYALFCGCFFVIRTLWTSNLEFFLLRLIPLSVALWFLNTTGEKRTYLK